MYKECIKCNFDIPRHRTTEVLPWLPLRGNKISLMPYA